MKVKRTDVTVRREGKDVEVREGKLLDETNRLAVVGVGLTRETRDDVGAKSKTGHLVRDLQRPASVRLSRMPSFHAA